VNGPRRWLAFGLLVVVAVALIGSLVTPPGRVARAARGGVAPVASSTVVCPNVSGGPGGLATDMTIARVTSAPPPQIRYAGLAANVRRAQRVLPNPATIVHKVTPYGPVAVTATGPGSGEVVASQTGLIPGGLGRALLATTCQQPGADWWLVGADGRIGFSDYLFVTNPSDVPVNVALSFWSSRGRLDPPNTSGIPLAAHSFLARPVSAYAPDVAGLALHVHANSGTVVAGIVDLQSSGTRPMGGDWIMPTAGPARSAVVTGFMPGATQDVIDLVNPGDRDASVSLRVLTPTKNFVPAGHQTVVVPAGRTTSVDLSGAVAGEAAAVLVDSDGPVAAAGLTAQAPATGFRDLAWLGAQPPLNSVAAVASTAPPFGQQVHLILTAPAATARVRLSTPYGTSTVVTVPAGRTADIDLRAVFRAGAGGPGPLLLTPLDAPVYAVRTLYATGAHGPLIAASAPMVLPRPTDLPPVVADLRAALP
jgi:hypothetical protein